MRRTSARLAVVVFALAITAPGIAAFICHPDSAGTSVLSLKGQVSAVRPARRDGDRRAALGRRVHDLRLERRQRHAQRHVGDVPLAGDADASGRFRRRAAHDRARRSARPSRRAGRRRSRHELLAAAGPRSPRHAAGGRRARGVRQPRCRRALGHPPRRRAHDVRRAAAPRRPPAAEHERRRVPGQHGEERSEDDDAPEVHPHARAPSTSSHASGAPSSPAARFGRSRPTGRGSRSRSAGARTAATASSSGTCRGASSARSRSRPA